MTEPQRDNPGVAVFPPVLAAGTLGVGLVLAWLVPWRLPIGGTARIVVSTVLLVNAVAIGLAGERAMHRAGTNVDPRKPSTTVVTTGPFRFSRNPLYLYLISVYLGITAAVASVWPLLLFLPMFLVLDRGIVRREERYLEEKFGESYRAYKARVRRWL